MVVASTCACAGFAAPSSSEDSPSSQPDGVLVLGVVSRHGGLTTERAVVADARTGATRARRLDGGALCHGPVLAVGRRVIASGSRRGRPAVLSFPLNLTGRPQLVARAEQFVPSSAPGRLWVARTRRHQRYLKFESLREATPRGRTVYRVRRDLPRWSFAQGSVADRLIFGRGNDIEVWDPRTGKVDRRLHDAWVVATRGSRLAWCGGACRAVRVSAPTTVERVLRPPSRTKLSGTSGAFSPDGRQLAVSVMRRGHSRVAVVDLETRDWRLVRGARLREYPALAWSPSGRWLYFTDGGRRLLAWRQGSPSAVPLPIRPRGSVVSIAAAPTS